MSMKAERAAYTDKELVGFYRRARKIMRLDDAYAWRETISIVNYSVFEDGVNLVPLLVREILRLRSELRKSQ